MREIGDKIILNYKKEERPMINGEQWDGYISCRIVFIGINNRYLVRNKFGYESWIDEDNILNE